MMTVLLLADTFPILWKLPMKRQQLTRELNRNIEEIAGKLLAETRKEKLGQSGGREDKSIIGLLSTSKSVETKMFDMLTSSSFNAV